MITSEIIAASEALLATCRRRNVKLATAESCTGGLIAGALTAIAGSSDVVDCGFVTYSNEAKQALVGVPEELLEAHGAVSEPVARAMASGALARSRADIAVSVTGVAGPGGGSAEKPVGLVHLAVAGPKDRVIHRAERYGDIGRDGIRSATILSAFALVLEMINESTG